MNEKVTRTARGDLVRVKGISKLDTIHHSNRNVIPRTLENALEVTGICYNLSSLERWDCSGNRFIDNNGEM